MIPNNLLILNYHKIEKNSDIGITTRHPDDFLYDLEDLVQLGYQTINLKNLENPKTIPSNPVILSFDDAYVSFFESAYPRLKYLDLSAVVFVPTGYIGSYNDWDVQLKQKKYRHMNESEIKEIAQNGIEIGSHAITHRYLNGLSPEELEKEVRESKNILAGITKTTIKSFSYPFGKYNQNVLKEVKKYYSFAVSLGRRKVYEDNDHLYTIPRINIYRTDTRKLFRAKLNYFQNHLIKTTNWLIGQGAWATILMQKAQNFRN